MTHEKQPPNNKRLLRVISIGNARYVAVGRLLPFLTENDLVEAEVRLIDSRTWWVVLRPTSIEVQVKHKRQMTQK